MSILPPRTSPPHPTASPTQPAATVSFAKDTTWTVQWAIRLRLPATESDPTDGAEIIDGQLVARLNERSIELELRNADGDLIRERHLAASFAMKPTRRGMLAEWTSPDRNLAPLARLLLTEGLAPVLRTTLPSLLGIPGGRHGLAGISAEDEPLVAGRISGDS